jgi:hypothetical protein
MLGAALIALGLTAAAHANGQTTHLWITDHALEHVSDPELKALLTRSDLRVMLDTGAMFPDGGYAVGHPYGEAAHWEPLQTPYLEWIAEHHSPPWTDDAAQHIAFLMGMASHGMADQVFDSNYMERARVYDADAPWDTESMDEATDVWYASQLGAWQVDDHWIPADELIPLFAEQDIAVDAGTLESAQGLLEVAVWFVGAASESPDTLADYEAQWPWATTHQLDDVPGAPMCEGEVVAKYWEAIYRRLLGQEPLAPVIATLPADGAWAYPMDAESPESMISIVFERGLLFEQPELIEVVGEASGPHEVSVDLFYGSDSHVLNIRPVASWDADERYTVTALSGMLFRDGSVSDAPWSFTFTTAVPPLPDLERELPTASGGCDSTPRAPGWTWLCLIVLVFRRRYGARLAS